MMSAAIILALLLQVSTPRVDVNEIRHIHGEVTISVDISIEGNTSATRAHVTVTERYSEKRWKKDHDKLIADIVKREMSRLMVARS